jgi:enoyl-[acyl-carrier-protein] reductase (NADH)
MAARDEVEARTNALAAGPWRALGGPKVARLAQLLRPLAAHAAVGLPFPNPIGLPAPGTG